MTMTSCMTAFQRLASQFFFSFFCYRQRTDLFGRLSFSYQNSYPNTFTSISRMNKQTNEQDGSYCFWSLLDLWLRKPKQELWWSFKSRSKSVKKITKITHFGETSTIPKTQKKVYDMITSGKDIMIQVRGICYQSKKLILICNNLKLWIEILAKYVNTNY